MDKVNDLYNMTPPGIDWMIIMPVLVACVTGLVAFLWMSLQKERDTTPMVLTTLVGMAVSAYTAFAQINFSNASTFANMAMRDSMSSILQFSLAVICFIVVLFSDAYLKQKQIAFREFYPLTVWATAGAMIMVSTQNLLMMFIGLEVLSISLYVMAGMSRYEQKSEESAMKYFLLGAFASAFFLYGIAFIYGATGSTNLDQIAVAYATGNREMLGLLVFGTILMLIGLSFKAAFVPFHQWTPDVYQGAPTNVTAFMAAASKVAAIGALFRVLIAAAPLQSYWMPAMFWIAILTMTIPNLLALVQKDVKRVLGFSSIANAGYVLVAILAAVKSGSNNYATVCIYLVGYSLMTLGSFAVISLTAKQGKEGTSFEDLNGLWKRSPLAAGTLVIFLASLIGIPPTGGFFGKLLIFQDAVGAHLTPLAIVLAVNSVISVYYYLRIALAAMVVDDEGEKTVSAPMTPGLQSACIICATGVIAMLFLISPLQSVLHR
ncbi:MAG: NADH-quinone oxidoreductase subunit N [Armatimonadetes bacterium]|nr:NADH-quinone oxidoreductase subunit N [Armatimonadota bacterium]